jgi:hypothetical protein
MVRTARFRGRRVCLREVTVAAIREVRMLASVADRDRAIRVLQESFAQGRLSREEFDDRIGQALLSRDFPELAALIGDLPAGRFGRLPAHRATPRKADLRATMVRRAWPRKRGALGWSRFGLASPRRRRLA